MRLKGRSNTLESVRTSRVLPRPGTPSSSTLPPAMSAVSSCSTTRSCPMISLAISLRMACTVSKKDLICSCGIMPRILLVIAQAH